MEEFSPSDVIRSDELGPYVTDVGSGVLIYKIHKLKVLYSGTKSSVFYALLSIPSPLQTMGTFP
jgi:hypothetical protein